MKKTNFTYRNFWNSNSVDPMERRVKYLKGQGGFNWKKLREERVEFDVLEEGYLRGV